MVLTKRRFNPKNTANYSADRVEKTQSIFQAEANSQVSTDLSVSIQHWLRKRGREVQHPITELQKRQLLECFKLIDTDGSGSLDSKELFEVFEVMGIGVDMAQVDAYVREMDADGSGELDFNEFLQIMHKQLFERDPNASVWKDDIYTEEDRQARAKGGSKKPSRKSAGKSAAPMMPLDLLAGAYRRKKVLEAVMENTQDMRKRLIASGQEFKHMNAQKQHDVETNTKQAGQAWRTKASANRVVQDRMADGLSHVDILNPSASSTPNVTPRVAEDQAEQEINEVQRASNIERQSSNHSASRPEPGATPSAKKTAHALWGHAKESDKLGQMVGAALVVKRDLHKRNELREKMESFQRRQPVFDKYDRRQLLKSDKVAIGILNDEMRSLVRIGVVPRASQYATESTHLSEEGPTFRPSTVPAHVGGYDGSSNATSRRSSRPSSVPIQCTDDADRKHREISDALAYKAIPLMADQDDHWLTNNNLADKLDSSPHQSRLGRPSTTPGPIRRMTPEGTGRDLLVKRRLHRDAKMKEHALNREFGRHAGAFRGQRPGPATGRLPGGWPDDALFSHRSGIEGQPKRDIGAEKAHGQQQAPEDPTQTTWVSPYTGRKGVPVRKTNGLKMDSAISSRTQAVPQPGVPIWKVSEQEMLKIRRPMTVQQVRSIRHQSGGEGLRTSTSASTRRCKRG